MDIEGGNKEKIRKYREWISLHFLILSPFPLHFLILSPCFRSLAARLPQAVQPCLSLLLSDGRRPVETSTRVSAMHHYLLGGNRGFSCFVCYILSLLVMFDILLFWRVFLPLNWLWQGVWCWVQCGCTVLAKMWQLVGCSKIDSR